MASSTSRVPGHAAAHEAPALAAAARLLELAPPGWQLPIEVRLALQPGDPTARVAAARAAGLLPDGTERPAIRELARVYDLRGAHDRLRGLDVSPYFGGTLAQARKRYDGFVEACKDLRSSERRALAGASRLHIMGGPSDYEILAGQYATLREALERQRNAAAFSFRNAAAGEQRIDVAKQRNKKAERLRLWFIPMARALRDESPGVWSFPQLADLIILANRDWCTDPCPSFAHGYRGAKAGIGRDELGDVIKHRLNSPG